MFVKSSSTPKSPASQPSRNSIIEIGCVEVLNRRLSGSNLHFYVNLQKGRATRMR